ncbi:MazG family protein [Treponema maltophilum ATCC 51939]|uniref:MazG family protein n=1 Tax=Treponema maltophilum ATCC 51939 TaxID=1125699 RepID=S3L482_TREMA|nr:nucleoside triphosphate pyrophosphohydrolase [Treponema maltophilum]EPF31609.1 MazG family protein [Treponema maltophilum ATCC 51939]
MNDMQKNNTEAAVSPVVNERAAKAASSYKNLYEIIKTLRAPGGCPWDREQTPLTLRTTLLEETYEALEAINEAYEDAPSAEACIHAKEELGDVMLNISMIAYMFEQEGAFTVSDVLDGVCEKLVRRHPHVFPESSGKAVALGETKTAEQVLTQWEAIKQKVEGRTGKSILDEVSKGLEPLTRAYKMQKKAAKKGFDWSDISAVRAKVFEEIAELDEALAGADTHADNGSPGSAPDMRHSEEEFGDILFALVNWARHLHIDPAVALERANAKFRKRFTYVENECRNRGIEMKKENLQAMDALWDEAKRTL